MTKETVEVVTIFGLSLPSCLAHQVKCHQGIRIQQDKQHCRQGVVGIYGHKPLYSLILSYSLWEQCSEGLPNYSIAGSGNSGSNVSRDRKDG
jgi:hypothetical protein